MTIIEDYWQCISNKLITEHPEEKPPADWTKSEAESFLKKLQTKTDKSISATTFRRIFKEGHQGRLDTRDIFAQYFDYPTYGDFVKTELKKKRFNWKYITIAALVALLIGILSNINFKEIFANSDNDTDLVETSIKEGIHQQFAAFKSIPNYVNHLDSLAQYYSVEGSAYKDIFSILKRQSGQNWTINNPLNASMSELLSIQVDSLIDNQAFVSTKEHWRLDWFSQTSQRYEYQYEATNDQTYILNFDDKTKAWKILQNSFKGNKFRYIPKYINCESISEQTLDLVVAKKYTKIAIENDALDLALKVLECYYSKNASDKFPNELSLLLSEKTKLLREVNTDVIDKTAFEIKKVALFEKILDFVK